MKGKGCFITLEGIDASGKSTLAAGLKEYMTGKDWPLVSLREPGGTRISEKIRQLLLDTANAGMKPWTEAVLYGAARRQLVEERIKPALDSGSIVLADRYTDSTLAYQGYGRGLEMKRLQELNDICSGGIKPDLTLLLDIEPARARDRQAGQPSDRLENEGLEFQEKVRNGYLELAGRYPERIRLIDASRSPEEVMETALLLIKDKLANDR
ncbi:MAG: dTMP kinase [Syntrophomonadaceae bacterium]